MPRVKRRRGWKKDLARATVCLTATQQARLEQIKLPDVVRPAVREIALRAIAQSKDNPPRSAEMRAALRMLRKRTLALQSALAESDEWTLGKLDTAGDWRRPVVRSTAAELSRITKAIESVERGLVAKEKPRPGLFALGVALQLRNVFEVFGLRFDRTKHSRAPETLFVILNFIRPTGRDAVDHTIREAEKFGE
jgi:hypothetical protein